MRFLSVLIALLLPFGVKCSEIPKQLAHNLENSSEEFPLESYDILAGPDVTRVSIGSSGRASFAHDQQERKESKKSKKEKKKKSKKSRKEKKRRHSRRSSSSSSSTSSSSSSSSEDSSERKVRKAMMKSLQEKGINHPIPDNADITQCPHYRRFLADKNKK